MILMYSASFWVRVFIGRSHDKGSTSTSHLFEESSFVHVHAPLTVPSGFQTMTWPATISSVDLTRNNEIPAPELGPLYAIQDSPLEMWMYAVPHLTDLSPLVYRFGGCIKYVISISLISYNVLDSFPSTSTGNPCAHSGRDRMISICLARPSSADSTGNKVVMSS